MTYAKVRELPESLQAALKSVGYARPDVEIQAKEKASRFSGGWSGQRAFCCIVDMATGRFETDHGSWGGSNMFNPGNAVDNDTNTYTIPPNVAVITGSSGGRGTFADITLRPDAIAPLLPAKAEVSPREAWIIYTFAHLTNAGRKNEWARHDLASGKRHVAPSEAELDALAARGFLKRARNGATQITTEGRNTEKNRYATVPYAPPQGG